MAAEVVWYEGPLDAVQTRDLVASGVLRFGGPLSEGSVLAQLQQADCLLHLESFAPSFRRMGRLSLSTKLPLYLASGRPILAWGPSDQASIRYLRDGECAVVVEREDGRGLVEALYSLSRDDALRTRVGGNGWRMARSHHEWRERQRVLREILVRVTTHERHGGGAKMAGAPVCAG